jgi:L-alanine-DL-glutamate epimerase-like enolase superfamily enzyme
VQISKVTATPVNLSLRQPIRMANLAPVESVTAIFVRIETRQGRNAWGCGIAHPQLSGENPADALRSCQEAADLASDLHPIDIEYSLAQLHPVTEGSAAATCAFDLAFHDLLGLAADMPLYRLLGGYRSRIQTSITIPIGSVKESVENARQRAKQGFRMLKIKGGQNPGEDVERLRAIHQALPEHVLRLDADGGYDVAEAIEVGRALQGVIEMLEQPTSADDIDRLREVTNHCQVPVLADQSLVGPASAMRLATMQAVNGFSVKMATCGGLSCARQVDTIARVAKIATMVSCLIEPALLIAAGLSFALSSPNVFYGDLDGNLELENDPTVQGFTLEEGWLVANPAPGLGCIVNV